MKQLRRPLAAVLAAVLCLLCLPVPAARAAGVPGLADYLSALDALEVSYGADGLSALRAVLSPQGLIRAASAVPYRRLPDCAGLDYFREENVERYADYGAAHPSHSIEQVVTYVNIGLDRPFYTHTDLIDDPAALDALVNKYHALGEYAPEVVQIPAGYTSVTAYLRPEASEAFVRMADAAKADGLRLFNVSAYRSYAVQVYLFNSYAAQRGEAEAETFSARAGFSEHQSGLTLDINTASRVDHFENSAEYRWLIDHCWDYGFILRYPADDGPSITGYIYEPWHYRYVGVELAQEIRDSGLTLDEFIARRPSEHAGSAAPAVIVDGLTPELSAVSLNGGLYVSANRLCSALGLDCATQGNTLSVSLPSGTAVLSGSRLSRGAEVYDGEFYADVTELAGVLGLDVGKRDSAVVLSSVHPAAGWPFTDVFPFDPCYDAVRFVWERKLFEGVSARRFAPDDPVTRAMALTVLWRLNGSPREVGSVPFADVPGRSWYTSAVAWAVGAGIADGTGRGRFSPNRALTCEQLMTFLYRYAGTQELSLDIPDGADPLPDGWEVSSWAARPMAWAAAEGLLPEGAAPGSGLTRAQLAQAMTAFCRLLEPEDGGAL